MTKPRSPSQQTLPRTSGRLPVRPASLSREAPMSQLISPPTDAIISEIDADTNPATTPRAKVSTPGQLYFSVPVARPTGSAAAAPRAKVSTPGQLYFSVPVARPTGSAAVTAPVGRPPEDALTRSSLEVCLGPSNAGRVAWPRRLHRLHSAALG